MTSEKLNITAIQVGKRGTEASHGLWAALGKMRERVRQRTALAHLDPGTQRDLGLTDAEIWSELQKPSWRP